MGRACNTHAENRNTYRILVGKSEGKRPLGRSRRRWVNDTKMDLCPLNFKNFKTFKVNQFLHIRL
jgi:hypothetical protein